ncbi:MAG: hypothetical protein HY695_13160 [Deltaproteobacteria bacterium]|nr:hypothetical protein [Deltaproteobacteria bacterium]
MRPFPLLLLRPKLPVSTTFWLPPLFSPSVWFHLELPAQVPLLEEQGQLHQVHQAHPLELLAEPEQEQAEAELVPLFYHNRQQLESKQRELHPTMQESTFPSLIHLLSAISSKPLKLNCFYCITLAHLQVK